MQMRAFRTMEFLFILTFIQLWWIAIWGLAYLTIEHFAGPSKIMQVAIYAVIMIFTITVIHHNPKMLDRL